jgi:hypothetical protein
VATHTGTMRASRPLMRDSRKLGAGMTATLSAELEGRVAHDLVADIVRAVLDEGQEAFQDGESESESAMIEARGRVERFIRARSSNNESSGTLAPRIPEQRLRAWPLLRA